MTEMSRPVTRRTVDEYNVLYASFSKRRKICVTLCRLGNDDMIEFREQGRRERFIIPVEEAFKNAVVRRALVDKREKARARKAGKKNLRR